MNTLSKEYIEGRIRVLERNINSLVLYPTNPGTLDWQKLSKAVDFTSNKHDICSNIITWIDENDHIITSNRRKLRRIFKIKAYVLHLNLYLAHHRFVQAALWACDQAEYREHPQTPATKKALSEYLSILKPQIHYWRRKIIFRRIGNAFDFALNVCVGLVLILFCCNCGIWIYEVGVQYFSDFWSDVITGSSSTQ